MRRLLRASERSLYASVILAMVVLFIVDLPVMFVFAGRLAGLMFTVAAISYGFSIAASLIYLTDNGLALRVHPSPIRHLVGPKRLHINPVP